MKTRPADDQRNQGLPPPPAPTSRDANPWSLSTQAKGARPGRRRVRGMPLAIMVVIAGAGVQQSLAALEEGDVTAAIGGLVIVLFVVFVALRIALRRTREVGRTD